MKRAEKGKRKKSERGGRTGRDVALCQNAALDPVFGDADAQVHSVLAHAHIHARDGCMCNFKPRTHRHRERERKREDE